MTASRTKKNAGSCNQLRRKGPATHEDIPCYNGNRNRYDNEPAARWTRVARNRRSMCQVLRRLNRSELLGQGHCGPSDLWPSKGLWRTVQVVQSLPASRFSPIAACATTWRWDDSLDVHIHHLLSRPYETLEMRLGMMGGRYYLRGVQSRLQAATTTKK